MKVSLERTGHINGAVGQQQPASWFQRLDRALARAIGDKTENREIARSLCAPES